jgi:hypothetical protein
MKAEGPTFSAQATAWFRLVLVLGLCAGAFGCKPKIGEDCATSTDCSISQDRLCDVTQPGGYCTVFNCEPNSCPADSACVAFSEGTCSTAVVSTRFRRTFCMATCEDDGDCRGGAYRCLDTSTDPARRVVDVNPSTSRVCAVPSAIEPPKVDEPAICFPSDASFDVSRPEAGRPMPDASDEGDAPPDASLDGRSDATDATLADRSGDATSEDAASEGDARNDSVDADRAETAADGAFDAADGPETGSDDVTIEGGFDATAEPPPDDADAQTDIGGADDAALD